MAEDSRAMELAGSASLDGASPPPPPRTAMRAVTHTLRSARHRRGAGGAEARERDAGCRVHSGRGDRPAPGAAHEIGALLARSAAAGGPCPPRAFTRNPPPRTAGLEGVRGTRNPQADGGVPGVAAEPVESASVWGSLCARARVVRVTHRAHTQNKLFKLWKKSPENPMNGEGAVAYNAHMEDIIAEREGR